MCVRVWLRVCVCAFAYLRAYVRVSESVCARVCVRPRVLCVRARVPMCVHVHPYRGMMHMRVRMCERVCLCGCVRVRAFVCVCVRV